MHGGMAGVIGANLRHRWTRSAALLAGILLATTSFAVGTSAVDASRLAIVGRVTQNFRSAYDILVRPRGAATPLERGDGLVQQNYLANSPAGISLAQYQTIRALPGVQVAAPVAVIGYVLQSNRYEIDLTGALGTQTQQAFRVTTTRTTDRGLSTMEDSAEYLYVTRNRLDVVDPATGQTGETTTYEVVPGGTETPICDHLEDSPPGGPFDPTSRTTVRCVTTVPSPSPLPGTDLPPGHVGATVQVTYPFLLAAVDPVAEAELTGLDRTVDSGRYLSGTDAISYPFGGVAPSKFPAIPVIVGDRPYTDDQVHVSVERLDGDPGRVAHTAVDTAAVAALRGMPGHQVATSDITDTTALRDLIAKLPSAQYPDIDAGAVDAYWSAGPASYRRAGPQALAPQPVSVPDATWASDVDSTGWNQVPMDSADTAFRTLQPHTHKGGVLESANPVLTKVGTFDPTRIVGFTGLGRVPLGSYGAPQAAPGDARTADLLAGRNLLPNANPAGYLPSPPLLLTTLAALPAFHDPTSFTHVTADEPPLTAIRVRVAGVSGPDQLSRTRIQAVADQIAHRTGLDVDVTIGSSPAPVAIALPAGRFGRPALTVNEPWARKGVAVTILHALDRKSLTLFLLILAVCALFVGNAASAAVRARGPQYALLAALGWPRRHLFRLALGELLAIGLAAGTAGGLLALPIGALTGAHVSLARAALAVPAAVVLTLAAAIPPAARAARAVPIDALRPAVRAASARHSARTVVGLGIVSALRVPGRTALAAAAAATGTAALTVTLAITHVFHGIVVGTLLGDAVAVQVRAPDLGAVAAIVAFGAFAVADVLYLNIRDRAHEYTLLRATGWTEAALTRLVLAEGITTGLIGAVTGAGLGLAAAALFTGRLPVSLLMAAGLAAAASTTVAALCCAVPVVVLRKLPTALTLADE